MVLNDKNVFTTVDTFNIDLHDTKGEKEYKLEFLYTKQGEGAPKQKHVYFTSKAINQIISNDAVVRELFGEKIKERKALSLKYGFSEINKISLRSGTDRRWVMSWKSDDSQKKDKFFILKRTSDEGLVNNSKWHRGFKRMITDEFLDKVVEIDDRQDDSTESSNKNNDFDEENSEEDPFEFSSDNQGSVESQDSESDLFSDDNNDEDNGEDLFS